MEGEGKLANQDLCQVGVESALALDVPRNQDGAFLSIPSLELLPLDSSSHRVMSSGKITHWAGHTSQIIDHKTEN